MAVSRITRELLDAGLVEEAGKPPKNQGPGRRQTTLRVRPDSVYVVGIVLSAFGHHVTIGNAIGGIVAERPVHSDTLPDAERTLREAADAVEQLLAEADIDTARVIGIGVSIAALVDNSTGAVLSAPYLGWGRVDVGRPLERRFGVPVVVENISNVHALAEMRFGACQGYRDILLIRPAATIGGSYIHDGEVVRGARSSAGQVGHLPVRDGELVCSCGRRDCLNTVSSGWSVLVGLGSIDARRMRAEDVERNAEALTRFLSDDSCNEGQPGRLLEAAGRDLAKALRGPCLVLDPEVVVLTGPLAENRAYARGVRSEWEALAVEQVDIIAGTIGTMESAVYLALDSLLYSPVLDIGTVHRAGGRRATG